MASGLPQPRRRTSQQWRYQQYSLPPVDISASQLQVPRERWQQVRAVQACDQCRGGKARCDEGFPCSNCKTRGVSCQYREKPPGKPDRLARPLQHAESYERLTLDLANKADGSNARLKRLEEARPHRTSGAEDDLARQSEDVSFDQDQGSKEYEKLELADHPTAPYRLLLRWPSLKWMLKSADVDLRDSSVMEARGHTRGKSTDKSDVTQPGSPASSEKSDDIGRDSESNAFAGAEGFWDTGFLMRPPGNIRRPVSHRCVGLKPNGSLDLNVNTINSLCGSYLQYIHSIHPFLDKPGLRSLFDRFINKYSRGQEIYGRFTVLHKDDDFERSNKRRRTYDGPDIPNPNDLDTVRAQFPERSAGDAICYLVLALGKICQHSQNLPSVAPDIQMDAKPPGSHRLSSAAIGNPPYRTSMDPSPIPGINSSDPTQSSNDDFHAHHFHMPRGSADGIVNAGGRNLECIPGLAYYTKACEVMGDQADGNDLCHVQMFLLAGLFKEKLGLMEESWSCITIAERASLMLLDRNGLYKRKSGPGQGSLRGGPEMIETKRQNLIVLAAWTCLDQFDGIRAELRFPPRHIQEIEDRLPYPKEVPQDKDTMLSSSRHTVPLVDFCYSSRIWLRQQLNDFSREMYGAAYVNQPLEEVRQTIKRYDNALNRSRRAMPAQLQWSDADPPASDIPAARLRAEYWAVRYVVNRPYLDYALHNWKHVRNGKSVREAAIDAHGRPRDEAEIRLFEAIQGLGETEIWGSVRTCIEAAMQSTVALDRVPAPLVVTNIHATAHAQFGTMLVLSAAFQDGVLKRMIDDERFKYLLERTRSFLRCWTPTSTTCDFECGILESIQRALLGGTENDIVSLPPKGQ